MKKASHSKGSDINMFSDSKPKIQQLQSQLPDIQEIDLTGKAYKIIKQLQYSEYRFTKKSLASFLKGKPINLQQINKFIHPPAGLKSLMYFYQIDQIQSMIEMMFLKGLLKMEKVDIQQKGRVTSRIVICHTVEKLMNKMPKITVTKIMEKDQKEHNKYGETDTLFVQRRRMSFRQHKHNISLTQQVDRKKPLQFHSSQSRLTLFLKEKSQKPQNIMQQQLKRQQQERKEEEQKKQQALLKRKLEKEEKQKQKLRKQQIRQTKQDQRKQQQKLAKLWQQQRERMFKQIGPPAPDIKAKQTESVEQQKIIDKNQKIDQAASGILDMIHGIQKQKQNQNQKPIYSFSQLKRKGMLTSKEDRIRQRQRYQQKVSQQQKEYGKQKIDYFEILFNQQRKQQLIKKHSKKKGKDQKQLQSPKRKQINLQFFIEGKCNESQKKQSIAKSNNFSFSKNNVDLKDDENQTINQTSQTKTCKFSFSPAASRTCTMIFNPLVDEFQVMENKHVNKEIKQQPTQQQCISQKSFCSRTLTLRKGNSLSLQSSDQQISKKSINNNNKADMLKERRKSIKQKEEKQYVYKKSLNPKHQFKDCTQCVNDENDGYSTCSTQTMKILPKVSPPLLTHFQSPKIKTTIIKQNNQWSLLRKICHLDQMNK